MCEPASSKTLYKDTNGMLTLACLVRQGASYNRVTRMLHLGMITQDTYEDYCTLWHTSVFRFSDTQAEV